MTSLFLYAIQSAIVLTLLYIPYTLLLSREKMFRLSRITLLAIMLLSLTLPLVNVSSLSLDGIPAMQTMERGLMEAGIPVENHSIHATEAEKVVGEGFPWFYVASLLYTFGMLVVLLVRLCQLARMRHIISQGAMWRQDEEGVVIYCHAGNVSPFSWLGSIVISEQDYNENGREIILHEKGHIRCHHSLDIMLLTLVQMLQWWNPTVFMFGMSLRDVHEYEADDYVLRQGVSAKAYMMLLVAKAVGGSPYTFVNSFHHSLTKRRIAMIQRAAAGRWLCSRVLYMVPLVVFSLSIFATPEIMQPVEEALQSIATRPEIEPVFQRMTHSYIILDENNEHLTDIPQVDKRPQYGRGKMDLQRTLSAGIRYPSSATRWDAQGTVVLAYTVETNGYISGIHLQETFEQMMGRYSFSDRCPAHERESIRKAFVQQAIQALQRTSGKWRPAMVNGQPVRVRQLLPVTFSINKEREYSIFSATRRTNVRCKTFFYI